MGSFYMNEAMFDLPDADFQDRTVTHLESTSPGGAEIVLLVERRPLPVGESLRQVAAEHGADATKRLLGYQVIFEREVEVASHPAIDVGARWRAENGEPVYSRRAHLALGSTWLMIVGEAPSAERECCDAYVDHVLASLRVREQRTPSDGALVVEPNPRRSVMSGDTIHEPRKIDHESDAGTDANRDALRTLRRTS